MFKKYQILWCDHVVLVNCVFLVVVMTIQSRRKNLTHRTLERTIGKNKFHLYTYCYYRGNLYNDQ